MLRYKMRPEKRQRGMGRSGVMSKFSTCNCVCFFFQAEDGIRDVAVTGVQTCALPISFRLWEFEARLWIPLTFSPDDLRPPSRSTRLLRVFARLKSGTDERKATAEMQTRSEERRVGKECRSRWSPDH